MEYQTTDIILAGTLKVHGCKLTEIIITGAKGTFVFEDASEEQIKDFHLGKMLVEPRLFNNEVRALTEAVRSIRGRG